MGSMLLFLQIWMLYINVMEHFIQQSDHFMSKGGESKRRGSELSMDLPLVLISAKFFVLLFVQLCGPSVDSGFWRMTSLMV